jgi:hypothetical protein
VQLQRQADVREPAEGDLSIFHVDAAVENNVSSTEAEAELELELGVSLVSPVGEHTKLPPHQDPPDEDPAEDAFVNPYPSPPATPISKRSRLLTPPASPVLRPADIRNSWALDDDDDAELARALRLSAAERYRSMARNYRDDPSFCQGSSSSPYN